jgi:hypothetical protein
MREEEFKEVLSEQVILYLLIRVHRVETERLSGIQLNGF